MRRIRDRLGGPPGGDVAVSAAGEALQPGSSCELGNPPEGVCAVGLAASGAARPSPLGASALILGDSTRRCSADVSADREQEHPTIPGRAHPGPRASRPELGGETGERVPTDMETWTEIRRKVLVEDASKRQTKRDHRIASKTDKILGHAEPARRRTLFGATAGPSDPSERQGTLPVPPSPTGTAPRLRRARVERVRDVDLEVVPEAPHLPGSVTATLHGADERKDAAGSRAYLQSVTPSRLPEGVPVARGPADSARTAPRRRTSRRPDGTRFRLWRRLSVASER